MAAPQTRPLPLVSFPALKRPSPRARQRRNLHQALKGVPVGIILTSVGGTRVEQWSSPAALAACPAASAPSPVHHELVPPHENFFAYAPRPRTAAAAATIGSPWAAPPPPVVSPGAVDPASLSPQPGWTGGDSLLWNAMVAPLLKTSIKGAIWYQGARRIDPALISVLRRATLKHSRAHVPTRGSPRRGEQCWEGRGLRVQLPCHDTGLAQTLGGGVQVGRPVPISLCAAFAVRQRCGAPVWHEATGLPACAEPRSCPSAPQTGTPAA